MTILGHVSLIGLTTDVDIFGPKVRPLTQRGQQYQGDGETM